MDSLKLYSSTLNGWVIPLLFASVILYAIAKKVRVYEVFVEGAKEGFQVAIMVMPFLVGILGAVALFRTSDCMSMIGRLMAPIISPAVMPTEVLLMSLMKPLSGSGARGLMAEVFTQYGPDSYAGLLASVIQGSTETTLYVVAVYFGAVGIRNSRHLIPVGLFCEFSAIVLATVLCVFWFGTGKPQPPRAGMDKPAAITAPAPAASAAPTAPAAPITTNTAVATTTQ